MGALDLKIYKLKLVVNFYTFILNILWAALADLSSYPKEPVFRLGCFYSPWIYLMCFQLRLQYLHDFELGGTLSLYIRSSKVSSDVQHFFHTNEFYYLIPLYFCSSLRCHLQDLASRYASVALILKSIIKKIMEKDKLYSGTQFNAATFTPVCLPKYLCPMRRKKCHEVLVTYTLCVTAQLIIMKSYRREAGLREYKRLCSAYELRLK